MKNLSLALLTIISLTISHAQTYTGQFYSSHPEGMHTDQWFNLKPNSGATTVNGWHIYHLDNSSLFQVNFGAANPAIYVGAGRTTDFLVSGKVGIGTNAPRGRFDVDGSGDIYLSDDVNAGTGQSLFLPGHIYIAPYSGSNTSYIQARRLNDTGSNALQLRTMNNGVLVEALQIQPNGSIGIGTVSPSYKLDVSGTLRTTDYILGNQYVSVVKSGSYRVSMNGQSHGYITGRNDSSVEKFLINSNGTTYFNGGNVGIGTTSPDQALTVNGKIHASEIIIDTSIPTPDYVFEENYSLTPLDEIKSYINQHKHLPEVPSAKEIEKDGLKVGEMEMILLKKIEELTLYVIELKQEINSLKKSK